MTHTPSHIEHINPTGLLRFDGISQVVKAQPGTMIFLSGQSAFNPRFELCGGSDFKAQAIAALNNVATAIQAAGGHVTDIVSSTVYVKGLTPARGGQFFEAMTQALDGSTFPVHALNVIGVQELGSPEQLIEITSTAVVKER